MPVGAKPNAWARTLTYRYNPEWRTKLYLTAELSDLQIFILIKHVNYTSLAIAGFSSFASKASMGKELGICKNFSLLYVSHSTQKPKSRTVPA
jgi:hypothetical protein